MRVYLSGPITGRMDTATERFNHAVFDAIRIFGRDVEIIDPLRIGKAASYYTEGLAHEEYMKISMTLLELCDTIYMMNGWDKSEGCRQELIYAENRGMTIVYQEGEE